MGNKLLDKLKVKAEHSIMILNAPEDAADIIGIDVTAVEGLHDVVFLFAKNSGELNKYIGKALSHMAPGGRFWIIYPKVKTAIPTDLNSMAPWSALDAHGVNVVASAAINEIWTAVRVRGKADTKPSGLCLDDIPDSPYAAYIDIKGRVITMPKDLQEALKNRPESIAFFNELSFTNKKEYVLWLLTAKQEKTRTDRLAKTVEKLQTGKKNPSEK